MQLESMWVHGIRRFGGTKATRLRLDSPIVCLIGANEVGKSTLLDALEMIDGERDPEGNWVPVSSTELTRDEDVPQDRLLLRLRYRLSSDERQMLRGIEDYGPRLRDVRWLERYRRPDGWSWSALLPHPTRDKRPRHLLAADLEKEVAGPEWFSSQDAEDTPAAPETVLRLSEELGSDDETLSASVLQEAETLAQYLAEAEIGDLSSRLDELVSAERRADPADVALDALQPEIPRFVRFAMADRELADGYDLLTEANRPVPALTNLANLAEIDLVRLLAEIQSGLTGSVRDRLEGANRVLDEVFSAWSQTPRVRVSLDYSGTELLVHIKSGRGMSMKPRERSEGLRQFVALVALTAGEGHRVPPILLIDEVEMHLHYDAQADLMVVLSRQKAASQVIYTTHSAGCLPEDLGASVRVVRGIEEGTRSAISQQFWSEDPGMVPLLLAMGAGSMAFVPLRPAVIAEGGSDLILLPTLIKEAAGVPRLGYQVVPGASEAPPKRIAGIDLEGVATVWVLDGDHSGEVRKTQLSKQGVPEDRIHLLEDGGVGIELEDLVLADTYAAAVTDYARDLGLDMDFNAAELPEAPCGRHEIVEEWCRENGIKEPGKTAIAAKILGLRVESRLLDPDRRPALRDLHQKLRSQLKVGS